MMRDRPRPFDCPIAGKTVGTALRHGGGLQEPAKVYVRCDERDCQYVDLNEPPCPLRIEMFSDGSDHRVAEYLGMHAGRRFCYACLTEALGVSHDQIRRASWRLIDDGGFYVKPARCVECRRRRVTIGPSSKPHTRAGGTVEAHGLIAGRAAETPASVRVEQDVLERLGAYLRAHPGFWLCVHCLARGLGANVPVVRDAVSTLERQDTFATRTAQCVNCLLTKSTIRHESPAESLQSPKRIVDFLHEGDQRAFCATCVAFACDVALADAKRILAHLEASPEFERITAVCAACGREQTVFRSATGSMR
jgi:hypothetical protein